MKIKMAGTGLIKIKMVGSGWHKESLRHRQAKKLGRAGGVYRTPIYQKKKLVGTTFISHKKKEPTIIGLSSKSLKRGAKVEREHKDTLKYIKLHPKTPLSKAEKLIARDHLREDPQYYTKLAKIEKKKTSNSRVSRKTKHTAFIEDFDKVTGIKP